MKYSYTTDLHGHSYYSDGKCSPKEIVQIASELNIDVIALTDHDLTFGLEEFEDAIKDQNKSGKRIIGIPGIEVTTEHGHIIFLFENTDDAKEFGEGIHIDKINSFDHVIRMSTKFNRYMIIPHVEVPYIGSFSFDSVENAFRKFSKEMIHTGLEVINGESQVMPKFLLKTHNSLKEKNSQNGWNKNLFANSDHHSKHGIGVGVTTIKSDKKVTNAKEFIELLKETKETEFKIQKILSTKELLTEYSYIISGTVRKKVAQILGLPRFRKL